MNLIYILTGMIIIVTIPTLIGAAYNRVFVPKYKRDNNLNLIDFWVTGFMICAALVVAIVISGMFLATALLIGKIIFQILGLG